MENQENQKENKKEEFQTLEEELDLEFASKFLFYDECYLGDRE